MAFQVACPHCNATIILGEDEQRSEVTVQCNHCSQPVRVRLPQTTIQPIGSGDAGPTGSQREPVSPPAYSQSMDQAAQKPAMPGNDLVPVVGTLVDNQTNRPAGSSPTSSLLGVFEPLLKTQNPTDVSLVLTAMMGGSMTAAIYLVIIEPLKAQSWTELFRGDTFIPHSIMFLTFWSISILMLKLLKLMSQRKSLSYELLPVEGSRVIRRNNVRSLRSHIRELPLNQHRNFLVRRVLLALDHYEVRGDVQEVGMALQTQGDIDAGRVESSYTMLQVFIWAVPILGFIGTVVGIGQAVDGFSNSLQNADELDAIKESLTQVTSGLATAFNTTLIALVMSIIIMFPANSLQKAEEDLLGSIEQYCNDHVVPRLQDESSSDSENKTVKTLEKQLREMMTQLAQGSFSARVGGRQTPNGTQQSQDIVGEFAFNQSNATGSNGS